MVDVLVTGSGHKVSNTTVTSLFQSYLVVDGTDESIPTDIKSNISSVNEVDSELRIIQLFENSLTRKILRIF